MARHYGSVKKMKKLAHSPNPGPKKSMSFSEGYYAGPDARMRQELEDSHMINEDHHAVANLPQQVMIKDWPPCEYSHYNLDDTIKGIDVQEHDDLKEQKKGPYPEKY